MVRKKHSFDVSRARRIVVLRALYLGDMLCAVPAFRALRNAAPTAHVALVGLPTAREFSERFDSYVDEFIEFPGWPGLPEQEADVHKAETLAERISRRSFDVAIQLHGSGTIANQVIARWNTVRAAGFYVPGQHCPDRDTFLPYPTQGHEIHRLLQLTRFLGAMRTDEALDLPLSPGDFQQLQAIRGVESLRHRDYICLHAGAKWASRRWPAERFAAVANALGGRGFEIVLTGTLAEQSIVDQLKGQLQTSYLDLCGLTSLGSLAALIHGARLVITNDTGVSHVAVAVRTPSVVLVLGSDPARWAPLDSERHRTVMAPVDCRPCEYFDCPIGFKCADGVTVPAVLAAAHTQLERWGRQRPTPAAARLRLRRTRTECSTPASISE